MTIVGVAPPTHAQAVKPRAVVELFTSQGCSSCPPADQLLGDLAGDPSLVVMSLPVDYWDYLGWKDTLADPRFSTRQRAYAQMRGDRDVYTPQIVVNGSQQLLGSDRGKLLKVLGETEGGGVMAVPVSLALAKDSLKVDVGSASGGVGAGEVWVCGLARRIPVVIGRGENRDRQVIYHNVVRRWLKVGDWSGKTAHWNVPLENVSGEGVDAVIVYVQNGSREKPGAMTGAAYLPLQN